MASAALPTIRRIPPPRIYATVYRRRSTTESKQPMVFENDHDHDKCLIEENELREVNRRQLIRIEFLERDYRQLDDDLLQLQNERDLLLKQKRTLEKELDRSSHHASANVDLHVYTQRLENECRDLRCQIAMREKEKFEFNEMIADYEAQIKQGRDRQEEWRETCADLESLLAIETETREYLEVQLNETARRQRENETQISRLKTDLDDIIAAKQDMAKTNYVLVQNAEALREQLRAARTQAAEAHMIRSLSTTLGDNLDESLPCLVYDDNEDHTPVEEDMQHQLSSGQSSLFSEINSLEAISDEMVTKYLDGTANDIELDLLLAKTTTLSSALPLVNQLINEVKHLDDFLIEQHKLHGNFEHEQARLSTMRTLLKRVLESIHVVDTRFRKLQLLLVASQEQKQCHRAELDDFFRLVDKRLVPTIDSSSDQPRLIAVLEAYEHEMDRLRQILRTNDETIRASEQELIEQQSMASRWRMKTALLEKNQRKLIDKIKELNGERRQLIESSTQKRTRRRALAVTPSEQQPPPLSKIQPSLALPLPTESTLQRRVSRSRSLPCFSSSVDGRKSRNDSGVVLSDELAYPPLISVLNTRRRIKSNISSQFVIHTSSHVCSQGINHSLPANSKSFSSRTTRRFQWFFLLFLFLLLLLFSSVKIFLSVPE